MTTPEVVNSNLDIGLVKEAVTVLSRAPRPRQEEVRPLQSKWGIARNREGMPRLLLDVIQELEQKVVNAAHMLQSACKSDRRFLLFDFWRIAMASEILCVGFACVCMNESIQDLQSSNVTINGNSEPCVAG